MNTPRASHSTLKLWPADRGKEATFFARWGGRHNQFGHWSRR